MKDGTLHSLLVSKSLYQQASELILTGERHFATAGLIVLQDALEITFLALLTEQAIDEEVALERQSFDELIALLRKSGVKIPKSSTLKALNRERVVAKHYGQLSDPTAVKGYLDAAEMITDSVTTQVLGKPLREVFLDDLLAQGAAKEFLQSAHHAIEEANFLNALLDIRKAIYVDIEHEYSIYEYRGTADDENGLWNRLMKGGLKAPSWKKNKEWIEKNVKQPVDYVQHDQERLRADAMDWGVSPIDLNNVLRLTPSVFRPNPDGDWFHSIGLDVALNETNLDNANYCLDRAILIIQKRQSYLREHKYPRKDNTLANSADFIGANMYKKADSTSEIVQVIDAEFQYTFDHLTKGFSGDQFYSVWGMQRGDPAKGQPVILFVSGYVQVN